MLANIQKPNKGEWIFLGYTTNGGMKMLKSTRRIPFLLVLILAVLCAAFGAQAADDKLSVQILTGPCYD